MAITATAQGKKFTFPDGTTQEQMGAAIDEFFTGQQPVQQPEITPEQQQAIQQAQPIPTGRGIAGQRTQREQAIALEELRAVNPALAQQVEETGSIEAALVGAGRGLLTIPRAFGAAEESPVEQQAIEALRTQQPGAFGTGEIIGQAAPFVAPGAAIGGIAGTAGRVAATSGLGATEAGLIAAGEGGTAEDIAKSAALGAALGPVAEAAIPAVRKLQGVMTRDTSIPTGQAEQAADIADEAINTAKTGKLQGVEGTPTGDLPGIKDDPELLSAEEIGELLRKQKTEKIAAEVMPDEEIRRAAEDLGIDLNPGSYSTNRAFIEAEQALKSRPGSKIGAQEQKAIEDLGTRSEELIADLGGTPDKSLLDGTVKNDFTNAIDDLTKQSDELYQKVDIAIPKTVKVKPLASRNYLDQKLIELGGDESLLTTAERKLLSLSQGNPTYAALDRIRKDVGAGFGKGTGPFKDDDRGILNQVYRVLSEDQQGVASFFDVGADYAAARKLVSQRKDLEGEAIKLFGRELQGSIVPKLRQAATNLTKGDTSKFVELMQTLPKNRREEAAATMLNDIFTQGAIAKLGGVGQGFVNAFDNLNRNQQAKRILFNELPEGAEQRFNKIGVVAKGIFSAKALENTSRTARDILAAMEDGSLIGKIYGFGKKVAAAEGASSAVGAPGIGTASVIGGTLSKGKSKATDAADELLTNPLFKEAVTASNERAARQASAKLQRTKIFDGWIRTLPPTQAQEIRDMGFLDWLASDQDSGANVENQGSEQGQVR